MVLVSDPALHAYRPIPLKKWILKQVENLEDVKVSICSGKTYGPSDECYEAKRRDEQTLIRHREMFMDREFSNLVNLKYNPENELGNIPYWLRY